MVAAAVLARLEEDVVAAHPPGGEALIARKFLVRDGVRPRRELRRHSGLVEGDLPQDHRRVVAVAPDQIAAIAILQLDERGVRVEVLPARDAVHDHDAELVAGVHERRRVRVMREAQEVEAGLLDLAGVPVLRVIRQGVADVGILLVPVGAAQECLVSVDAAPVPRDGDVPDADTQRLGVHGAGVAHDLAVERVEVGCGGTPQAGRRHLQLLGNIGVGTGPQRHGRRRGGGDDRPVRRAERGPHAETAWLRVTVAHVGLHPHRGGLAGHARVRDEDAPARGAVGEQRVCDVQPVLADQVDGPVQSAVHVEVELRQRLGAGDRVVVVVQPHGQQVVPAGVHALADVEHEGEIAA